MVAGQRHAVDRPQAGPAAGWEQIEVPTDKAGLLAFLNEHRINAVRSEASAPSAAGPAPALSEPTEHAHDDGKCSLCKRSLAASARAADRLAEGMEVDAICTRIEEAEGPGLTRFAESVIARFRRMQSEIGLNR